MKNNLKQKIYNKKTLNILILSNVLLFASYLFFVGATTFQVVSRKNTEEDVRNLQSVRAGLENSYNEYSKNYTKDFARSIGFVEAIPTFYVTESVKSVAYDGNNSF